jgi:hypothetical protein
MSDLNCPVCSAPLDRTRYFPRQLLTAEDMRVEQEYFRQKLRRHNLYLHGWGIVCGLSVIPKPVPGVPLNVTIASGYALSPQGDEIFVPMDVQFDLAQCIVGQNAVCRSPCAPVVLGAVDPNQDFYIAVKYIECPSHPVRVSPVGCGCDDTACEYSRIREGYEVTCFGGDKIPKTYMEIPKRVEESALGGVVTTDDPHRRILLSTASIQG